MIGKYKNIIIVGIIIALGLIAYSLLRPDPTAESLLATTERADSAQVLGDEITSAINQINALKLNRSVFDDPIVKNLIDHSKPIIPEPVGRKNPFAPIGAVGEASVINSSTSTLQNSNPAPVSATTTSTATSTIVQ
jgi:hypothetical protein